LAIRVKYLLIISSFDRKPHSGRRTFVGREGEAKDTSQVVKYSRLVGSMAIRGLQL
jgi:hypothetical protein